MVELTQGWGTPEGIDIEMNGFAKDLIVDWLNAALHGDFGETGESKMAAQGLLVLIDQDQVRICVEETDQDLFMTGFVGSDGLNKLVRSISLDQRVVMLFHGFYPVSLDGVNEGMMEEVEQRFIRRVPRVFKVFQDDVQDLEAAGYEVVDAGSWTRFLEVGEE